MADESSALSLHEPLTEADYDLIHDAVLETQRGRWFLHEYAKRNRHADTGMLLAAIERIDTALRLQHPVPQITPPASPLSDLRESLDQAKENLGTIKPDDRHKGKPGGKSGGKSADFDLVATSLKAAIAQMQAAIGPLRDTAYAMREEGVVDRFSDSIEGCASDLSAGCGELDRAATDIIALLRDLAGRLEGLTTGDAQAVAPASVAPAPGALLASSAAPASNAAPAANAAPAPSVAPPSVEPAARSVPASIDTELGAQLPLPVDHAIPGFEPAPATDEPVARPQSSRPEITLDALTLDPLVPASDAGLEAWTEPQEPPESIQAPAARAMESEPAEQLILTESATVPAEPEESVAPAADAGETLRGLEIAAERPPGDFEAKPIEGPEEFSLEPVPAAEAPPAVPIPAPVEAVVAPRLPAAPRRHPDDALAPIVALSDEEKIALFS